MAFRVTRDFGKVAKERKKAGKLCNENGQVIDKEEGVMDRSRIILEDYYVKFLFQRKNIAGRMQSHR